MRCLSSFSPEPLCREKSAQVRFKSGLGRKVSIPASGGTVHTSSPRLLFPFSADLSPLFRGLHKAFFIQGQSHRLRRAGAFSEHCLSSGLERMTALTSVPSENRHSRFLRDSSAEAEKPPQEVLSRDDLSVSRIPASLEFRRRHSSDKLKKSGGGDEIFPTSHVLSDEKISSADLRFENFIKTRCRPVLFRPAPSRIF